MKTEIFFVNDFVLSFPRQIAFSFFLENLVAQIKALPEVSCEVGSTSFPGSLFFLEQRGREGERPLE